MFGIFSVTTVFEILVLIPGFYTVLQLVMSPTMAFMLSCLMNLVTLAAIFICKFKPGPFIYKVITVVLSVLIALAAAGISSGALILAAMCIFIFSRARTNINTGRNIAVQLSSVSIIINIPLALIFLNTKASDTVFFGNTAICISTVTSIIIMVIRQVDDSRRFGKSSINISRTQRKNNQIFAGIILSVLMLFGSFGQITEIYKFVLGLAGNFFDLLAYLFAPHGENIPEAGQQMENFMFNEGAKPPSLLEKIFLMLVNILGILIIAGVLILLAYYLIRLAVKMIIKLITWFKAGGHIIDVVSENGHTDEKESLLNRNVKNLVLRLQNLASGILKKEVPYSKLPDDITKVRRLMKYFINRVRQSGAKVAESSTAQEICRGEGGISPAQQFNALLADCYDKARYDNTAPEKEQLRLLEEELLRH